MTPTTTPGRVRVLQVLNTLGAGGAERSSAELVGPLRDRGIDVDLAILFEREHGVINESVDAPVHRVGGDDALSRARALRRLADEVGADVVHSTIFDADLAARLARPFTGRPLLCSLVNTTYEPDRLRHDGSLRRSRLAAVHAVDALTGIAVDHFHAITGAVADSAQRHLRIDASRLTVVPRGRDERRLGARTAARRRAVRDALGIGDDIPVLLALGRQEAQKGHRFLLEALPAVLERHPGTVLLLAGREGGATAGLVDAAARLGLGPHLRRLGHRTDAPDLLVAADALVFPSVYEGLGGALLEAMALGTPVVASDLAATREVLGDDGALLVPPADPSRLADAVAAVLADAAAAGDRAAAARRRFDERYTLDASADGMAALYRTVVRRYGRGRARAAGRRVLGRSPLNRLAARANRRRLTVLAYHDVPDRGSFEAHLDLLGRDAVPVSLGDVLASSGSMLPHRAVLVTFDDGDRSVLEHAAPALHERGIPAVAFVVAGLIGTDQPFWWRQVAATEGDDAVREMKRWPDGRRRDAVAELARRNPLAQPQLQPDELVALQRSGIEIGSHSLTHPILDRCPPDVLEREVHEPVALLAGWLGRRPRAFAYPNGDHDPAVRRAVADAGYEVAFVFDHRVQDLPIADPLTVSRVRIDASDSVDRLRLVVSGLEPRLLGALGRVG